MANVVRDGLWPCVCLERALAGRAYYVARPLPCVRFERVVVVVVRVVRTERCQRRGNE